MSRKRKKQRPISACEALDMVPDDLPDGAFFEMGAGIAGMDYDDFIQEVANGEVARTCMCADPENCTQTVPGYRCKREEAK